MNFGREKPDTVVVRGWSVRGRARYPEAQMSGISGFGG